MPVRPRNVRSEEYIAAVRQSVCEDPNLLISHRSHTLEILRKDLGLRTNKIVITEELKPNNQLLRGRFSNFALEKLENSFEFYKKSAPATKLISGLMVL